MPSRREFFCTTAKALPLAGAAAMAWDRADQLADAAPSARYWLAVDLTPGVPDAFLLALLGHERDE